MQPQVPQAAVHKYAPFEATALRAHITAGELGVREVRSVLSRKLRPRAARVQPRHTVSSELLRPTCLNITTYSEVVAWLLRFASPLTRTVRALPLAF